MLLKTYLKALYGLSEECDIISLIYSSCPCSVGCFSKCLKFSLGKKSAIGDKPATKRNQEPIQWNRLTFATKPLITVDDMDSHKMEVGFPELLNPLSTL